MEQRFTETQLERIVTEAQRLHQRQQEELDAGQVRDILQELNLPPELLEEAMVQVRRSEALATRQRRSRRILIGAIGSIAVLALVIALSIGSRQQTLAGVKTRGDRLTLTRDNGSNLNSVSRPLEGEVLFYRVTLANAPTGQKLALSCNWIAPDGRIVHQNHYRTKEITTPVWNTFCRYTPGADTPAGRWKVELFLGDRLLDETTFEVR